MSLTVNAGHESFNKHMATQHSQQHVMRGWEVGPGMKPSFPIMSHLSFDRSRFTGPGEQSWKAQSNVSLERFISQHRNAFVSLQQCSSHVQFQLPNVNTQVGCLLDAVQFGEAPFAGTWPSFKMAKALPENK